MDWLVKDEEAKQIRLARNPTGRFGKPEEIVHMAVYLASDETRWTNGATLVSTAASPSTTSEGRDGGQTAVERHRAIGVDVGGSGIKAAVVDVETGALAQRRGCASRRRSRRRRTRSSPSIARIVKRLREGRAAVEPRRHPGRGRRAGRRHRRGHEDRPRTSTRRGSTSTVAERLEAPLKRPVVVLNDADAAGLAEMRFGVGRGRARASSSS